MPLLPKLTGRFRPLRMGGTAVLLCALLLIQPVAVRSEDRFPEKLPEQTGVDVILTDESYIAHYELVAETANLKLYADMEKGWFALKDLRNGEFWYSTPSDALEDTTTRGVRRMEMMSQLVVEYVYKSSETKSTTTNTANSQVECVNEGTVTVQKVPGGIRVDYLFKSLNMHIPAVYTIDDHTLTARILLDEIEEGDVAYLIGIKLLPSLGAANSEQTGYALIPDGSGALLNFGGADTVSATYEATVYGEEKARLVESQTTATQTVSLPVFGLSYPNKGILGVITQGDGAAKLYAILGGNDYRYTSVGSQAMYRQLDTKSMFKSDPSNTRVVSRVSRAHAAGDYEVVYYPLLQEEADYVGMAQTYRAHLMEHDGLQVQSAAPTFHLNLYGSVDMDASFLGIPYTRHQKLTTFEQAQTILETMAQKGMTDLSVTYTGWSGNGAVNKTIPVDAKPLGNLGGSRGWQALGAYAQEQGISLYPEVDLLRFTKGGNKVSARSDSIKTVFGDTAYLYTFLPSVYQYDTRIDPFMLLTPGRIADVADRYLQSYTRQSSLKTLSLGDLGWLYYSDLGYQGDFFRTGMRDEVTGALSKYRDAGLSLEMRAPNAYALPYASRIIDMPLYSSQYDMFTTDVPFYQLVLHGAVPMATPPVVQSANPSVTFLKAVETGCELLYAGTFEETALDGTAIRHLYSTEVDQWLETAAEQYAAYMPVLRKVHDQTIVGHREIQPGVFRTDFENGVFVVVNYTDEDVPVGNRVCAAMDFITGEGEAS